MIPENLFPDLAAVAEQRSTAVLLGRLFVERLAVPPLVGAFTTIVDGSLIDYQLSRDAHYAYYRDPLLGGGTPISARLVPSVHHVENCVTNAFRALLLCDAIRRVRPGQLQLPLVHRLDWKGLERLRDQLRNMRDAIQHVDQQLQQGVLVATAMLFDDAGKIVFGTHAVVLTELADGLRLLNGLALKAAQTVPAYVGP